MAVKGSFDEIAFLAPLRALMRGWSTDTADALLHRVTAIESEISKWEASGRFIIGNATHLKALREVGALRAREGELYAAQLRAEEADLRRRAPVLVPGTRWHTDDGRSFTVEGFSAEGRVAEITWDNGCPYSFSITSPLHMGSRRAAA